MKNSSSAILMILVVFLSSCSILGTSEQEAEAQFSIAKSLITAHTVNINIDDGDKSQSFSNQDFQPRDNTSTGELATPVVQTSPEGLLSTEFELLDTETNQQISVGSFQLDLKEDWRYSIYMFADSAKSNPTEGCFGCIKYFSFGFSSDYAKLNDSLYVILSGNSISDPVIY